MYSTYLQFTGFSTFHQLFGYKCFIISIPFLGTEIEKKPNFTLGSGRSINLEGKE